MNWKIRLLLSLGLWHEPSHFQEREASRFERPARKCLLELLSYFLLLLGLVFAIYSYWLDASGASSNWFQRSGAIVVATSLFVEYRRFKGPPTNRFGLTPRMKRLRNFFVPLGFILAVLGTAVWAYGDLFMRYFVQA
jgi:hypothetical protein